MHIAVAADRRFDLGLVVTVHTLLQRTRGPFTLSVLTGEDGLLPRAQAFVERRCREAGVTLVIHSIPRSFGASYRAPWAHHSTANLFRLMLPELLADHERVLYLDCDLVVADDVRALWDWDLKGHAVGAVRDLWFPTMEEADAGVAARRELGFRGSTAYFNSGVLVMDLDVWRREQVAQRTCELLWAHMDVFDMADQDALNLVLQGEFAEVEPRWNVQIAAMRALKTLKHPFHRELERMPEVRRSPGIVHFTGPHKPWNAPGGLRNLERSRYSRALVSCGYLSAGENARRALRTCAAYARIVGGKVVPSLRPVESHMRRREAVGVGVGAKS
ncbi:MAG TPA: glycosyltransferase family 8 protein [Phycisphaerales bacterium]|nr:glycosyltransferase family 8 protein [Phycisphaerales bacterium]